MKSVLLLGEPSGVTNPPYTELICVSGGHFQISLGKARGREREATRGLTNGLEEAGGWHRAC